MASPEMSRRHLAALAAAGAGAVVASPALPASADNPTTLPWFDIKGSWGGPGAVGDGTVDDTAAIQRAINAAVAQPGGSVVLAPSGRYKITGPVTFPTSTGTNVNLIGAGKWQTRFVCASPGAGLRFANDDGSEAGGGTNIGGFWVDGGNQAWLAMNHGLSSYRRFFDIQISDAPGIGVLLKQIQNSYFEGIHITKCGQGLVLDVGASNNQFDTLGVHSCGTNIVFQNSWDGTGTPPSQFSGVPRGNKFINALIERANDHEVDHKVGIDNVFIASGFSGNGFKFRFRNQGATEPWKSKDAWFIDCFFNSGAGIEHTAQWANIRMITPKFSSGCTPAFTLGDGCFVQLAGYVSHPDVVRFANAAGGTWTEEQVIRTDVETLLSVIRPAAGNAVFEAFTGTHVGTRTAHPLYRVKAAGELSWGPGTAAPDVKISRPAAGRLRIDRADGSTTQPTLLVNGALGVANSATSSVSTPASVDRKIQVFDANGNPIGYIPVYNTL